MDRIAQLLAAEDEWRGSARAIGGLLLGAGLVVVFFRRSLLGDAWGDLALLAVLLAAVVILYGTGLLGARATGERPPWQGVFLVFGILVVPLALLQLVSVLDGDRGAALNLAWIFAVTAAAAGAAAATAGLRYGLFLASLALIAAWIALWDGILADGAFDEIGTLRVLLLAIGLALAALGAGARQFGEPDDAEQGNELLTGGAVGVVGAGAISGGAALGGFAFGPLASADPTTFWDAYLLLASLAAILLGASLAVRGLGYVGAVGLAVFILVVGFDLDEARPEGSLLGWPLIVLALGAAAFLASLIRLVELPEGEEEEPGDEEEDEEEEPGDEDEEPGDEDEAVGPAPPPG